MGAAGRRNRIGIRRPDAPRTRWPVKPAGNTRMKCLLRYAVYAVLSILLAGTASADPIPPQLIGTWRLVSNTLEEVASGRKTDLMGKDPIGFISYGADGRM